MFNDNPHVEQLIFLGAVPETNIPFRRILLDTDKREVYTSFNNLIKASNPQIDKDILNKLNHDEKTVIHWGQRKLLISEIEFLTKHSFDNQLVVYVGAAPGRHITYLSSLFPTLVFHLYDPVKFDIRPTDKIKIFQQLFTDVDVNKYVGKNILFISDIRSVGTNNITDEQHSEGILRDLRTQESWYINLRPHKALLKFRFPYTSGQTEYLDGDVYFQAWEPVSSTESRLVPYGPDKRKIYNHTKYEEQFFYYNNNTRVALYPHNVKSHELDHCYDCTCEIHILREYLTRYQYDSSPDNINQMSGKISKVLSSFRTLRTKNPNTQEKNFKLNEKTNVGGLMPYIVSKNKQSVDLFTNKVKNSAYNLVDELSIPNVETLKLIIGNTVFREINKIAGKEFVYGGEGPKQETYVCFFINKEGNPICGYIIDNKVIGLANSDNNTYLIYDREISRIGLSVIIAPNNDIDVRNLLLPILNFL